MQNQHSGTQIRAVELHGPEGRLEARLNTGRPDAPFTALLCHPHPLAGGNLHNKVLFHAMKVVNSAEWGFQFPVLRFNFRGTGLSAGRHDGLAESQDVLAALEWLRQEYRRPILLLGYSFGAAMALKACAEQPDPTFLQALALLGLPISKKFPDLNNPAWLDTPQPKLLLSGKCDEYASMPSLEQAATATKGCRLVTISDADHFFSGQIEPMQQALATWLKEFLR